MGGVKGVPLSDPGLDCGVVAVGALDDGDEAKLEMGLPVKVALVSVA